MVAVTPSSVTGQLAQDFQFDYKATTKIQYAQLLIGPTLHTGQGCHAYYEASTSKLWLSNDNGSGTVGSLVPDSTGTIANSRCRIGNFQRTLSPDGQSLALRIRIEAATTFTGSHKIWMSYVMSNYSTSQYQRAGTWTVPSSPSAITVAITPSQAVLGPSAKQQFSAAVSGTTNTAVTWSASQGTISAAGLYTAPATVTAQVTATVTATSVADTTKKATATVTLKPAVSIISGAVTPSSLGAGTKVVLGGAASVQATTDGSGNYSFPGLANGTYTITPTKAGVLFTPPSRTVTLSGAAVTANFTAATQTWNISGAVNGSPATLTLSGAATASMTTDSAGKYSFSGLKNGSYVVAPSKSGYAFTPSTALVNIDNASVSGVSFTAQAVPSSVKLSWTASTSPNVTGYNVYRGIKSGGPYTKLNGSPVGSLTFVDGNVSSGHVYFYVATAVDGSGNESTYSSEAAATVPAS